jgi:biopolymer transport protein ExbD
MGAVDVGGGGPKQKGRKKGRRGIRIDMTPMVDIAFLLLIFFMVTTVFRRPQALELTLPSEKSEVEVPEQNVMQIRVDKAGQAWWNIGLEPPAKVEVAKVHEVVHTYRKDNPALCAVIKIDRDAPYHYMVDILDEVTMGKLTRYSLAPLTEEDRAALTGTPAETGGTGL